MRMRSSYVAPSVGAAAGRVGRPAVVSTFAVPAPRQLQPLVIARASSAAASAHQESAVAFNPFSLSGEGLPHNQQQQQQQQQLAVKLSSPAAVGPPSHAPVGSAAAFQAAWAHVCSLLNTSRTAPGVTLEAAHHHHHNNSSSYSSGESAAASFRSSLSASDDEPGQTAARTLGGPRGSSSPQEAPRTHPAASRRGPTEPPGISNAQRLRSSRGSGSSSAAQKQLDSLEERLEGREQEDDLDRLVPESSALGRHHPLAAARERQARAATQRSGRSSPSSSSSQDSTDLPDDFFAFHQPGAAGSRNGGASASNSAVAAAVAGAAVATAPTQQRQQQQQQQQGKGARRPAAGSPRLLAVTHGAACSRGRQKPDMQDHHLMVQDMLDLAVRAARHAAALEGGSSAQKQQQQQQQQGQGQGEGLVVAEGDLDDVMQALSASGGLHLHQCTSKHSTTCNALRTSSSLAPSPSSQSSSAVAATSRAQPPRDGSSGASSGAGQQPETQQPQRQHRRVASGPSSGSGGGGALRCSSSLTGVFDGHCGSRTSRYAARRLPVLLARSHHLWAALEGAAHPEGLSGTALSLAAGALHEAFARLDFEILEEDRLKPPGEFDGCTALVGLQVASHLLLANLGDSRAVLSRGGQALRLTTDHTPELPEERKRIEACGGYVREHRGVWRLVLPLGPGCGLKICAVSRALGDIDYKEPRPLLSATPDVFHCALQPHADRFAIYASDGVWGVVPDQQAVDCVNAALTRAELEGRSRQQCAELAAQALRAFALERGSGDDITAVVTVFDWEQPALVAVDTARGGSQEQQQEEEEEEELCDDAFASVSA